MTYKFDNSIYRGKPRHLHTLDGKPLLGTSTVLGVLNKTLTWWASGLAVGELGWTHKDKYSQQQRFAIAEEKLNTIKQLNTEQYLGILEQAYKAHSIKLTDSAKEGTDMHSELEKYVKMCIASNEGMPLPFFENDEHIAVQIFIQWARENVELFVASEAHCYSRELWTGGIVDLIFIDKKARLGILDFKSAKDIYMSQFLQNAGYDIAISENGMFDDNGNSIGFSKNADYYGVFAFGMEEPKPEFCFYTQKLREGFRNCVALYKLEKEWGKKNEMLGDILSGIGGA